MSSEITFDSIDLDNISLYYSLSSSDGGISENSFHKAIYSPLESSSQTINKNYPNRPFSITESKTQRVAQNQMIIPVGNVKGEVGGTISWGGEDGVEISGYVSGSASDDRGNTASIEVEINSDGSGSATVSGSHDEDTNS